MSEGLETRSEMERKGGIPPMFFEVCGSGLESMSWNDAGNECAQGLKNLVDEQGCVSKWCVYFIVESIIW